MNRTESVLEESQELAGNFFQSADLLVKTAELLKRSGPSLSEDLVRELSSSRKSLLDLCGRILKLEKSFQESPHGASAAPSEISMKSPIPALSRAALDTALTADEDDALAPSAPPRLPSDSRIRQAVETILADLDRLTGHTGKVAPSLPATIADRFDPAQVIMDTRWAALDNESPVSGQDGPARQFTPATTLVPEKTEPNRGAEMARETPNVRSLAGPQLPPSTQDRTDPLQRQALELTEKALRTENAATASTVLGNLALLYHRLGNYALAESLHKVALAFREKFFGAEHPLVGTTLNNLAVLYRDMRKYAEAEALCRRSLEIAEKKWGPDSPKTARRLGNLADLCLAQGNSTEAEPLYQRALAISEDNQESEHPAITASLQNYAEFLRKTKRRNEAAIVEARSKAVRLRRFD